MEDPLPIQVPFRTASQTFEDVWDTLIEGERVEEDRNWCGLPSDITRLFLLSFLGERLPFVFEARTEYATLRSRWTMLRLVLVHRYSILDIFCVG